MKISTRGRYGVRIMLDLAIHDHLKTPIPVRDISARQEISEKYIEQIISTLKKSGLVYGIRGQQGGYVLSVPPQQITVGKILRVTEGDLSPVDCVTAGGLCARSEACVTRTVWKELGAAVDEVVDNITLADLLDRCNQLSAPNYVI